MYQDMSYLASTQHDLALNVDVPSICNDLRLDLWCSANVRRVPILSRIESRAELDYDRRIAFRALPENMRNLLRGNHLRAHARNAPSQYSTDSTTVGPTARRRIGNGAETYEVACAYVPGRGDCRCVSRLL